MFQMWKMKIPEKKWLIFFQKNAEVTEKKLDQLWISGSKTIASFLDTMCRGTHSLLTEEIEEYSVSSGLVILAAVYHYAMPQSVIPLKHCQWQSLKTVTYYSLLSPIILVSQDVSFSNSTYFSQKTAETLVYFPFCFAFVKFSWPLYLRVLFQMIIAKLLVHLTDYYVFTHLMSFILVRKVSGFKIRNSVLWLRYLLEMKLDESQYVQIIIYF